MLSQRNKMVAKLALGEEDFTNAAAENMFFLDDVERICEAIREDEQRRIGSELARSE